MTTQQRTDVLQAIEASLDRTTGRAPDLVDLATTVAADFARNADQLGQQVQRLQQAVLACRADAINGIASLQVCDSSRSGVSKPNWPPKRSAPNSPP